MESMPSAVIIIQPHNFIQFLIIAMMSSFNLVPKISTSDDGANDKAALLLLPPPSSSSSSPSASVEYLSLTSDSLASQAAHQMRLRDMEARKIASSIQVPTLPQDVRDALRQCGEPIRLFGEDLADIRNRLRMLLAKREIIGREQQQQQRQQQQQQQMMDEDHAIFSSYDLPPHTLSTTTTTTTTGQGVDNILPETTYTHASQELIAARKFLCQYSLSQSRQRLEIERQRRRGMIRWTRNKKRARLFDRSQEEDDDDVSGETGGGLYQESSLKNDAKLVQTLDTTCEQIYTFVSKHVLEGSQYGDIRPLSAICTSSVLGGYSHNCMPKLIATGGWSGGIKIWSGGGGGEEDGDGNTSSDNQNNAIMSNPATTLDGDATPLELLGSKNIVHEDRIMGIAMRPFLRSLTSQNDTDSNVVTMVATASIDLTAKLCLVEQRMDPLETFNSISSSQINNSNTTTTNNNSSNNKLRYNVVEFAHLRGHAARLCKVAFHPTGKYVATTSFDHTWRLWDVETSSTNTSNGGGSSSSSSTELLLQDGHAREVYGVGFHPDGSLLATSDFGGVVQCWDLRTGKSACHFVGHAKRVLCCEYSPNGFQLVSAGDDGTVKVWDMRRFRRPATSIPAHTNLITQLKFAHSSSCQNGEFLVSSSFDGTGKIWSTRDWKLLSTLRGHDGKVMGIDILDGPHCGVVTCGFDKTLKLWQ